MKVCPKCNTQYGADANFCPNDATRLVAAAPAPVPTPAVAAGDEFARRFAPEARVGGTRTGELQRARDSQTGLTVALKVLGPRLMAQPGFATRAERELGQLARVSSSQVARLIAHGRRADGSLWYATEWLNGAQTLEQALRAVGRFDVVDATRIVTAVGEGVIEAAKAGVVHHDLAPKNVLLAGTQIQVVNFVAPTAESAVPGVAEFVPPEVIEGRPADQRGSIYSLGALFYTLVAGAPPYSGTPEAVHRAHVAGGAPPLVQRVAVPPALDSAIARALDVNPARRYLTIRQFLDELQRLAEGMVTAPVNAAKAMNMTLPLSSAMAPRPAKPATAPPPVGTAAAAAVTPAMSAVGPSAGTAVATPISPAIAPAAGASAVGSATAARIAPVPAQLPPAVVAPAPAPAQAESGRVKNPLRETLWFKKGELDASAAEKAAQAAAKGQEVARRHDNLDPEERYVDDGSITSSDREKFSVRNRGSGTSIQVPRSRNTTDGGSADAIVGEMKSGRTKYVIAVVVVVVAIILAVVLLR